MRRRSQTAAWAAPVALGVALAALLAPAVPGPVRAEVERLQPDFAFRRVGVPQGDGPRITVQIDPDAPSAIRPPDSAFTQDGAPVDRELALATVSAQPGAAGAPVLPAPLGFEWFWNTISPRAEDTGPGRLEIALAHIANSDQRGTIPTPRMQTMQDIAAAHGREILGATVGTRVSPALVLAVISVESAGRPDAVSHAGAQGLMQLMPDTAARFGVTDSLDPAQNIAGGVKYLDWLLGHFDGDPILALAGYNAGEGNVRDHSGVPPFAETRGYVPKVLSAWTVARGLCVTPPVLMSDGCVFNVNAL